MFIPRPRTTLALDYAKRVQVFNRTAKVLVVRCDGRSYDLEPGLNEIPAVVVPYAQRQHPRKGTFERGAVDGESLVGIVGVTHKSQMTALEPGKEHLGDERINRREHPVRPINGQPTIVEHMGSERTRIDMASVSSARQAAARSSVVMADDNGGGRMGGLGGDVVIPGVSASEFSEEADA